jgi:hypothetical protein
MLGCNEMGWDAPGLGNNPSAHFDRANRDSLGVNEMLAFLTGRCLLDGERITVLINELGNCRRASRERLSLATLVLAPNLTP